MRFLASGSSVGDSGRSKSFRLEGGGRGTREERAFSLPEDRIVEVLLCGGLAGVDFGKSSTSLLLVGDSSFWAFCVDFRFLFELGVRLTLLASAFKMSVTSRIESSESCGFCRLSIVLMVERRAERRILDAVLLSQ